jgi:hypothetical protein
MKLVPITARGITMASMMCLSLCWAPTIVMAHRSGCHRWHTCPSDTGSYTMCDTGHCSTAPSVSVADSGSTQSTLPTLDTPPDATVTTTPLHLDKSVVSPKTLTAQGDTATPTSPTPKRVKAAPKLLQSGPDTLLLLVASAVMSSWFIFRPRRVSNDHAE